MQRDPKVTEVFGREYATSVGETIKKKTYPKPNQLTIVIDGSNGLSPHFAAVLKELRQLPADLPVKLVYVRDDIMTNGANLVAEKCERPRCPLEEKSEKSPVQAVKSTCHLCRQR